MSQKQKPPDVETRCWLCDRELGARVEWHHPVPKQKGGHGTVPLHPICHRTIHANFSNTQLARIGDDRDALAASPAVATFLRWVKGKPPDFHAPTRKRR
ncbi:MAG: HNH endonuclease [Novosphingobium sp.]